MHRCTHVGRQLFQSGIQCLFSLIDVYGLFYFLHVCRICRLRQFDKTDDLSMLQMIQCTAASDHIQVRLQRDLEIVAMPVNDQITKRVDRDIFRCVHIVHIAIDETHEPVKQLFHDLIKGIFLAIQKTAVTACAVIHTIPPDLL